MSVSCPTHLKLWIPTVSPSFQGNLYFILGPGLGDTVNDFRLLKEILNLYPSAKGIVYAASRWTDLYQIVPELHRCDIRLYPPAPSGVLSGDEQPFHNTFDRVVKNILEEIQEAKGYIALGGFKCADQLAKKEAPLSVKARAIGLLFSPEKVRPYLPLVKENQADACCWISSQNLSPGQYIAFSPQTYSDKRWSKDSWNIFLEELYNATQIPFIMVGVPEEDLPTHSFIKTALGLPLPVVARVIAGARCFIGLDSGLTHVAACFNVPIVTLNPNGKFPPFLVEALSPFKLTILTPGIYGEKPISPRTVLVAALAVLQGQLPRECPLCHRSPYLLDASQQYFNFLCRCGLIYRIPLQGKTSDFHLKKKEFQPQLPIRLEEFSRYGDLLRRRMEEGHPPNENFQFDHWDPIKTSTSIFLQDQTDRDVWWTWDAAHYYLKKNERTIISSSVVGKDPTQKTFQIQIQTTSEFPAKLIANKLHVPWGGCILSVRRSLYEDFLSWGTFRKQDELEGLGWYLVKEGQLRLGRELLWIALRVSPRVKTLGRLMRAGCWYRKFMERQQAL